MRWWLACGAIALAALITPATGHAHAELRSAEPAPGARLDAPESVRLVLSSPVEEAFLRLEVIGPRGERISGPARRDPRDARAILAPVRRAPPGRTVVVWRVLSQDGHPTGGAFALRVGASPAAPAAVAGSPVRDDDGPLAVLARLLALAAPLGLLGLVTLSAGVVAPAVRLGGVAPPGRPPAERDAVRRRAEAALAAVAPRWWAAWWALAGAWALGLALVPVVLLRGLREGPGGLWTLLSDTRAGAAWWVQLAGVLAAVAAALALRRAGPRPPAGPAWAVALGLGPAAAMVAISWAGHASSGGDRTANIVIDALHSAATAAWLGGLLGLAVLAIPAVRSLPGEERVRLGAGIVVRFSALALVAVTLLVVTGVYRALAELPSVGEIADSGYGRALLVKLGLFAVLLIGGAYNRLVLHPRLERAALGLDPGDRGASDALRISVGAELAMAAVLMVSVAVLISLPPPL